MKQQLSDKLYSAVLHLYPKDYRQEYGTEMRYVFRQSYKEARAHGRLPQFWLHTLADAFRTIPTEHMSHQGDTPMKQSHDIIMQNKAFGWVAVLTLAILAIPLIAMQFTSDVQWSLFDFLIMGAVIFILGSGFILIARHTRKQNRLIIGVGFLLLFLYIWAELAVGIFTNFGS